MRQFEKPQPQAIGFAAQTERVTLTYRHQVVHGLFDTELRHGHFDGPRPPFAGRHDVLQDVGVQPFGQQADAPLLVERRQDHEHADVAAFVR